MCSPIRCENCSKIGWTGCGQHVEDVMAGITASERCTCR